MVGTDMSSGQQFSKYAFQGICEVLFFPAESQIFLRFFNQNNTSQQIKCRADMRIQLSSIKPDTK